MRRVLPPEITLKYSGKPESERQLNLAYSRIFMIAKRNILARKNLEQKGGEHENDQEILHLRSSELLRPEGKRFEDGESSKSLNGLGSKSGTFGGTDI